MACPYVDYQQRKCSRSLHQVPCSVTVHCIASCPAVRLLLHSDRLGKSFDGDVGSG